MAATLKEASDEGDHTWREFALVARDLVGERPLEAIPLAARIAAATVDAFEQRYRPPAGLGGGGRIRARHDARQNARYPDEVFLFLDDYHLVTDPAIRRAVPFLLRHAPSHLHLVLTTRLEPPLSLGGLLAKNRLLEVDASVLRFDYSFARPISPRGACLHPPRADGTVRDV